MQPHVPDALPPSELITACCSLVGQANAAARYDAHPNPAVMLRR